jgi:3-hydroxyacyl-CoA dehydrogenase
MSKVAIVGTGFIGRAWAISLARAGHDVVLWDAAAAAPADALAHIDTILLVLAEYDLLSGATPGHVRACVRIATTLEQALGGADHVQENTPEDVGIKRRIFARLDAAAMPQAILASSISAILPSQFTEAVPGRARCLRSIRPTSSRRLKWCRRRGCPRKRSVAPPIF